MGTFTREMTMPDGTVIPPTGTGFDLGFAQTSERPGDQLIVISAFWGSALQKRHIGRCVSAGGVRWFVRPRRASQPATSGGLILSGVDCACQPWPARMSRRPETSGQSSSSVFAMIGFNSSPILACLCLLRVRLPASLMMTWNTLDTRTHGSAFEGRIGDYVAC
jgi:hypothetical protein